MAALPYATAGPFRARVCRVNCVSSTFVDRPTGRRNHLRRKILKILKEPVAPKLPVVESIDPVYSPPVDGFDADEAMGEYEKLETVKEVESTVKSMEGDASVLDWLNPGLRTEMLGKEQHSFWKYGIFFVGAFVFQTLHAVLFIDGDGPRRIDENERNVVHDKHGNGKGEFAIESAFKGMGSSYLKDMEIEKKIEEIRTMAKEARDMEMLELEMKEDDGVRFRKSGIEEEAKSRLNILRKRLENSRSAASLADDNGSQDMEYKYKFNARSFSKARGFVGSNGRKTNESRKTQDKESEYRLNQRMSRDSVVDGKGEELKEELDRLNSEVLAEEDGKRRPMMQSTKNSRKKMNKGFVPRKGGRGDDAVKSKVINGISEERNVKPSLEALESGMFQNDEVHSRKVQTGEAASVPNNVSNRPSGLQIRDLGSETAGLGESKRGFWWSKLPYVLVIRMWKGVDGEDGEGLYTLKSLSYSEDQISHMIAFQDRTDAINFCYLLQSFFEDANDCTVDVVPLPVKELIEGVNSGAVSAFVVKKGALELYAGQPFADAEMALRALTEEA